MVPPDYPIDLTNVWPATPEDEHRSRDALDRLRLGFQIIGFDWQYLYVNPAAARHGRRQSPRELAGRTMMDAYPGIERSAMFGELERSMRDRRVACFENEFTFPDGSTHWFELRVEPVPEGICVYSIDIQERRAAALALARRLEKLESRSTISRFLQTLFGR